MKIKSIITMIVVLLTVQLLRGQSTGNPVTDLLLSAYSERNYTTQLVTDQQLDIILNCGIKAPSARNQQPWRFTVIKDEAAIKEIISDAVAGNVLIIISGAESQTGTTPDFDCGLAAQSMFVAAHGLGLGARIYGSPAGNINSKKDVYQVPAGFKAVVVLRVGNVEKPVDAVSSATPRKAFDEIVNFKK
jgi:nitroreductase